MDEKKLSKLIEDAEKECDALALTNYNSLAQSMIAEIRGKMHKEIYGL